MDISAFASHRTPTGVHDNQDPSPSFVDLSELGVLDIKHGGCIVEVVLEGFVTFNSDRAFGILRDFSGEV